MQGDGFGFGISGTGLEYVEISETIGLIRSGNEAEPRDAGQYPKRAAALSPIRIQSSSSVMTSTALVNISRASSVFGTFKPFASFSARYFLPTASITSF